MGCSVTCNQGIQTRTKSYDEECTLRLGAPAVVEIDEMVCDAGPGYWLEWGAYGACDSTCIGTKIRTRLQSCSGDQQIEANTCGADPGFGEFSEWSECTVTCGGGTRARERSNVCSGAVDVETEACNTDPGSYGAPSEWSAWTSCSSTCIGIRTRYQVHSCGAQDNIEEEVCGSGGDYESWGSWSPCSQSCAGGSRSRQRGHTCNLPVDIEAEECGAATTYSDWSSWTTCSLTCGGGVTTRRQKAICGTEDNVESLSCGEPRCCILYKWSSWQPCSVSCGVGVRIRTQASTCSDGLPVNEEIEECDSGPGQYEADWSAWSFCSVSCAGGTQNRFRVHTCLGTEEETRSCNPQNCPSFGPWVTWTDCLDICTNPYKTRNRVCVDGDLGQTGCIGSLIETADCDPSILPVWSPWTAFSECTVTCGGGTQTRSRDHDCLGAETETQNCNTDPGAFSEWTEWSTCTVTCGGGTQGRSRVHSCTGVVEEETQACNTDPGSYYEWSGWSECSTSCGQGTHTKIRGHSCVSDNQIEVGTCTNDVVAFDVWGEWSGCSATCIEGIRTRSRSTLCGVSLESETQPCIEAVCAYWAGWTRWSACSTTCFEGVQLRTRSCQAGVVGDDGCTGDFEQTKSCYNEGAYSEWEFASECSKVCGGGTRIKRRENTCTGPEEEVVSCNEHTGQFSDWSTWSSCSKTGCGGGLQKRSKIQSCTFEVVFETKKCNENAGLFGPWTEWTECTRSCGGGSQTRSQVHSCNEKINVEKRFCGTQYCPIWEGWGSWAPCSVSCGVGTQSKQRKCRGGNPGDGFCTLDYNGEVVGDTLSRVCVQEECCEMDWSGWSDCCMEGTESVQLQVRGNRCTGVWVTNTRTCEGVASNIQCSSFIDVLKLTDGMRLESLKTEGSGSDMDMDHNSK